MIIFAFDDIFLALYLLLAPKYFTMNFNSLLSLLNIQCCACPSGGEVVTCLVPGPHPQK
jgi:hypothetical protein